MSEQHAEKGPIAWMTHNSVAANLLMMFFLAGGSLAYFSITQEVFPDITEDIVNVSVSYPGASPEEIEHGIVQAIEEAVGGLTGVEELTSTASEGLALVSAELIDGADPMQVYQDIKSEVDRIRTFPEDAERPEVSLAVRRRGVMHIALYGKTEDTVLKQLAEYVRDRLLNDPNITQVDIVGTRDLEIGIEIPQENLRRYGLTIQDIADKLARSAIEIPGGGLKTRGGEILVRVAERRDYGHEFGEVPVLTAPDGVQVLLKDLAVIHDGLEEVDRYATFNGMPAVQLTIYRVAKQTPMQVADATFRMIDEIRPDLPDGIDLTVRFNMAAIYIQRSTLLLRNGALGLVLVFILLGLFLELRLAFWVMLGIPISFLGSLLLMPLTGLSLNMVTLFAYIVTLGIVVDDAIVVGENVYRHHEEGMLFLRAAVRGTQEVASPVAFSILTNMLAFLPLYVLPGMMGRILGMLPVVVITVFAISWAESIFILPAHLGHQRDAEQQGFWRLVHTPQQWFSKGFRKWVHNSYAPFLSWALNHRYIVLAAALAIFVITIGYLASGRLGFQMFPQVESDYAYAEAILPYGTPVEQTGAVADRMIAAARKVVKDCGRPELVTGMFGDIGDGGTHKLNVRVYLADPEIRRKIMSTEEFAQRWRQAVGRVQEAKTIKFQSDRGGPGSGSALMVELSHSNVKVLERAATDLAVELENFPNVSDIDDGFLLGKEQLSFTIKPTGRLLGLRARDVARQVRNAYEGAEVLRQQRGRNELKVKVRLPQNERISEGNLEELILRTPNGGEAPLNEIVEISRGRAYTTISHREGRRTMTVSADVRPRAEVDQVMKALDQDVMPSFLRRYPGLTYSYEGRQAERRKSLGSLFVTIPIVLLGIYTLLAIPFKSYIQPMIVMVSIPFGVVGAVIGHLIMGYSMSMIGMIGIVALSGVVVNDALVMVDFINNHRKEATTIREAVINASVHRFRPILLTTLTTFGGLAPMIFETSRQARFLIPMAISLGYGLLFATSITLLLVPCLYMIVEDLKQGFAWSMAQSL